MSLKYGHVDDVYEYRLNKYLCINLLYNVITTTMLGEMTVCRLTVNIDLGSTYLSVLLINQPGLGTKLNISVPI